MPQVTVYVRKEDLEKWKALDHKAAWLHEQLNNKVPVRELVQKEPTERAKAVVKEAVVESIKDMAAEPNIIFDVPKPKDIAQAVGKDYNFCKHDQVKGFCKHGCK